MSEFIGGGGGGGGGVHSYSGRFARISPTTGRRYKIAYTPCPVNDIPGLEYSNNCLAIPMSSIQTTTATTTTPSKQNIKSATSKRSDHYASKSIKNKTERCSGFYTALPLQTAPHDMEAPQPLVDRKPSISLLRWNNYNFNDNGNTQTSGSNATNNNNFMPIDLGGIGGTQFPAAGHYGKGNGGEGSYQTASKLEPGSNSSVMAIPGQNAPKSLTALDRDCFIIPEHSLERFLPAGIPLPPTPIEGTSNDAKISANPLSVLEVSDPKMCILVHLMSPLEPIDPVLESPLSHPLLKQKNVASELLKEVQQAKTAVGGMLLANMEKCSEFPFIAYYIINTMQTDPTTFYSGIRVSSLTKFEPKNLKYTAAHTLDLYSEVAAICRPPLMLTPNESGSFKHTQTPATGYIISVFKVFEGDDGERFEKNWLYWTGARMLYRYLPRTAGLRRIALHKSTSRKGDKMYLLICECAELLNDINSAAILIPALRARLCGYTGLYRPIQAF